MAGAQGAVPSGASLDYYLIAADDDGGTARRPAGILVEEFVLADDHTATGLDNAGWTTADGGWWSSAALGREVRTNPDLRRRITPIDRHDAETVYRRLSGRPLPAEATLRTYFRDTAPLPHSPPLVFTPPEVPAGFHEERLYRVLFANDVDDAALSRLHTAWTASGDGSRARVSGASHLHVPPDSFSWRLHQIGPGIAWCLDVTALLGGRSADVLAALLRELTKMVRLEGLIPVTIERLS
ncbi:hypothetical protein AB0M95_20235 [Sphaerisporangium sp. NPDC051017]|uniref:hypothetical protein n=1 Tax=Sphaerisporangium sp. NPDC051017 TaxID=3154636 RepID=UPI00342A0816